MVLRRALLAVGLVWVGCAAVQAQRLPGGVRPVHYALTITPDLAKATFAGSETIDLVLDKPASAITLNAAQIQFGAVTAYQWPAQVVEGKTMQVPFGNKPMFPATVTLDAAKEQATFTFARELPAGPVTLQIAYTGILNNQLRGFYLSKTKTRSYGVTQFEATDARRAFPCFDEPALKATFQVTLVIDAADTAISNTKMVSDRAGPLAGRHTVVFAPTPKMSTYLVAWVVGDFVCTKAKSDGVPIRVCATPDKVKLTKFALQAAKWDLHYYDGYFGIKYPLAKLDLVAIPDFEAGAMENFGCITFRETKLLVDAKDGTLPAKKEVAQTVAHEMAHQWFGDLVTPAWWDNIWLNEGFATWMETKAPAIWQPKWGYEQDDAVELNETLDDDSGRITRPILAQAETPAEINALFDDIAYGKAGAVIGMVEHWVGEATFQKGVQAYLTAHAWGNATAEDFWDAQTQVSGLPVDKVMRSFVEQPGVPLVTVTGMGKSVPVLQQRFFLSGPENGAPQRWTIPICFSGEQCGLLEADRQPMSVPEGTPAHPFVYANAGDKGYYRTEYSQELLRQIVRSVETGLTAPERIGLIGDSWALMQAGQGVAGSGQGAVGQFLDLVLALKQDPDATVMDSALGRVGTIESRIATGADRERLDAVVRREFGPVYAALRGPKRHEPEQHADLRETLFEALGEARDQAVLAEAESMTRQLFSGQKVADPELADAAVALATVKGDTEMYERLLRVSQNATDPDLKEAALNALTRFESPILAIRTLEYAVSDQVRSQDSWTLIALLLQRRATQDLAWEFVQQHWAAIERKATESSGLRIEEAAGAFCTVERRDEVASFFAAHPVAGGARTLAKSLDSIDDCIHLRAAEEPALREWLAAHGG